MGYRIGEPKPRPPRRDVQDVATPMKIYVHNYCTARIAIPCWYDEVVAPTPACLHDRMMHDHLGWPSPNHPDRVCQDWDFVAPPRPGRLTFAYNMGRVSPIHLTEEGYTTVEVRCGTSDSGDVVVSGFIDPDDDWVVRVNLQPKFARTEEPVELDFSAYVVNESENRTDLVCLATLVVLPALGVLPS